MLPVGKFGLPDKDQPNVVHNVRCKCRECRVSVGVKRPRKTHQLIRSKASSRYGFQPAASLNVHASAMYFTR